MTNTFKVKPNLAIDVSYYEPIWYEHADYEKVNPKPLHVIARATYGVRKDTEFINHWNYWKSKGVPVAAYHYWYGTAMYSGQTAADGIGDQAENFIAQIMAAGYTGKERLWLDIEEYGNAAVANGLNFRLLVKQWLDHVERVTGQKPGIYSRKDQLERMAISGAMPPWINDYDMWWAWYPDGAYIDRNEWFPKTSNYRPSWYHREPVMWQYSDGGFIDGFIMKDNHQPTTYDFNSMLVGYLEELGGSVIPPPSEPPIEVIMTTTRKGTARAVTNIKSMSGVPSGALASLPIGGWVLGNLSSGGTDLIDITAWYRPTGEKLPLSVPCKASVINLTVIEFNPEPPPPDPDPDTDPIPDGDTFTVSLTMVDDLTGRKYGLNGVMTEIP
jgi:GH25 family lysozyme M1 (1,4-beta-N-acetylmuramidase)